MSETTPRLGLPLVAAGQAQKHVPVNEALARLDALVQVAVLDRDRTEPPEEPSYGDRHIVGFGATGAWSGRDGTIASHDETGWTFLNAGDGWFVWDAGAEELLVQQAGAWRVFSGGSDELQEIVRFGLGTEADEINPFSAKLNTALWTARETSEGGTGDLRYVMNKEESADVLSLLLQSAYSGRAEIGLVGDDDLLFKVSADGSAWKDALRIDRTTGRPVFPQGGVREVLAANRTYYVRTDGADGNSGLSDTPAGAFRTIQKAIDVVYGTLDLGGFNVTIRVADGTYTGSTLVNTPQVGKGTVTVVGNLSAPSNVLIDVTSGNCFAVTNFAVLTVRGVKMRTTGSGSAFYSTVFGIVYFRDVDFGLCATYHVRVNKHGYAEAVGPYSISGGALKHYDLQGSSVLYSVNVTITISGTLAFSSAFIDCLYGSTAIVSTISFVGGSATGKRYNATMNSIIVTAGGGANYFPGDVAGTISTGAQYG